MNFSAMPRITAVALALPVLAFAAPAAAQSGDFQPEGGVYVSVNAGVTSPSDELFTGVQAPAAGSPGMAGAPAQAFVEYDEGFTGTAAIGYQFPTRVLGIFQPSVEIEYGYGEADVSGGNFNGGNQTFGGGIETNTLSVNYQSDIRWSQGQRVIPFIGGGIGIADVNSRATYFPNNGVANAPTFAVTDGGTGLSLQSNAGLQFKLTDKLSLQGRVRYQRISGLDFQRTFIGGGNNAFNANLDGSYETVSVLAGLRFKF